MYHLEPVALPNAGTLHISTPDIAGDPDHKPDHKPDHNACHVEPNAVIVVVVP